MSASENILGLDLSPAQFQLIGVMMVAYAGIDHYLSFAVRISNANATPVPDLPDNAISMGEGKVKGIARLITEMEKIAKLRADRQLDGLLDEFKAAIELIRGPRNLLAHGVLTGGNGQPFSLWNHSTGDNMTVDDVIATAPIYVTAFQAAKAICERVVDTTAAATPNSA